MTGNDKSPLASSAAKKPRHTAASLRVRSLWESTHKMPPVVPGTRKWDKRAIDAKLDEISGLAAIAEPKETDLQKWRRERDARRHQR